MRVLLSVTAYERYWSEVAAPGVDPVVWGADGRLRLADGSVVAPGGAVAEVAWGTSDVYPDPVRREGFFDLLRGDERLRWYQSFAAGFDGSIYRELASRGVRVTNAHVNDIPIAEYVLRAVLDRFQRADLWREEASRQRWRPHDFREIYGSTWLVVGLGSLGSAVAVRARAFGATVIGCRRTPRPGDPVDRMVTPDGLLDVVGDADVVVLAASANASSQGIADSRFFGRMKPGSVFVNVARGSLVDEGVLLAALDRGVPEAAVLDVFAREPLPSEHPLWRHPAVTVTPHNAAGGVGRYRRQADLFGDNLRRYLAGGDLRNDVSAVILAQR